MRARRFTHRLVSPILIAFYKRATEIAALGLSRAAVLTSNPPLSDSVGGEWWLKFAP